MADKLLLEFTRIALEDGTSLLLLEDGSSYFLMEGSAAVNGDATLTENGDNLDIDIAVYPVGIVTAEAFGTPKETENVQPSGIASVEVWGTAKETEYIQGLAIASAEAFGNPGEQESVKASGISSAETFGTAKETENVKPTGVASAEAWGTPGEREELYPSAINSEETFGTAKETISAKPPGITSSEVFGTAKTTQILSPSGIASAEEEGKPGEKEELYPVGIPSGESEGIALITLVPSGEAPPVVLQGGGLWGRLRRQKQRRLEASFRKKELGESLRLAQQVQIDEVPRHIADEATVPEKKKTERRPPTIRMVIDGLREMIQLLPRRLHPRGVASEERFGRANIRITLIPEGFNAAGTLGKNVWACMVVRTEGIVASHEVGVPRVWVQPRVLVSDEKKETIRRGARIYSPGTAEGFKRMRRMGIPRTPFNLEDQAAQLAESAYSGIFRGLVGEVVQAGKGSGFREQRDETGAVLVQDADPGDVMRRLHEIMGKPTERVGKVREKLNKQLVDATRDFFEQLMTDADKETRLAVLGMELPKREAFWARIEGLRDLYLDQAVERIAGEEDALKEAFLRKLVDWAEGRTDRLHVSRLMAEMKKTSARRAKFFARDQFARFNRALTTATYQAAEAPYVEWITVGDERVRPLAGAKGGPGSYYGLPLNDHRVRNHRIYTMAGLLADPEYSAYNCRCGLVPHWRLTPAMEGRMVA